MNRTRNGILKAINETGDITEIYPKTKIENVDGLVNDLEGKVDKVSGKQLSTEDYTTAEKNKLAGIAAGATANTGTVTGVKVGSTSYSPSSGIVNLPAYPTTLPASDVSSWAKASSKPSYTASEVGAISTAAKGTAGGVAELDATGKIPSSQLPASVDQIYEAASRDAFPATGTADIIYVAKDTNLCYRWGGSAYVEISPSLALGETSSTAYRGDRGKTAYTHATDPSRLTAAKTTGFYKFSTTDEGHIAGTAAVTKSDITNLGIPAQDTTYSSATQSTAGLMSATDKTKLDGIANGATANIGTVTQVKCGNTAYNPSNGVVSLPGFAQVIVSSEQPVINNCLWIQPMD